VSNLRKKLDSGERELIKNVRGVGYQLVRAGSEVTAP
jgi:DNA-binding response OmpR family regulator